MRAFTVLFLMLTVATHAADTAYTALRVLGAQRGEESLQRVVELRGSKGTWKILLTDGQARTGAREIQVRGGRIIREASVPKPEEMPPALNLSALNLDSDGALMAANRRAAHEFTADQVDYTLANSPRNVPVWTLKLREPGVAGVTSMQIAAQTGEVIEQPGIPGAPPYAVATDGLAASEDREPPNAGQSPGKKSAAQPFSPRAPEVSEAVERTVDQVERGVRRLKRFLPF